jgi:nitrogen regulatory protein PII
MVDGVNHSNAELICFIVNYGLGSKIVKYGKQHGVSGGTIFFGKGTIKNKVLMFLELYDIRKELVFMIAGKNTALDVMEKISMEFKLSKPNHGIAFSIPISTICGAHCSNFDHEERGMMNVMYNSIFVVVDKGRAEDVIDAAEKAGSTGGTIINARGSGVHETSRLFSMDVEPEKEIVLILSETEKTQAIVESIRKGLNIDAPGNGVIFVQDVSKVYGLYKKQE